MIITEPEGNDTKDRPQLANSNPSQPLLPPSGPPPPPYAPAPAPAPNPSYHVHYPDVPLHHGGVVLYHESAAKRFWKAFAVALLIWFLAAAFTNSVAQVAQLRLRRIKSWVHPLFRGHDQLPDAMMARCLTTNDWTTYHHDWRIGSPLWAETNLSVPLEHAFFLLSRGSYQHGRLNVEQSDSLEVGERAVVQIRATYRDMAALGRVDVCELHRGEDEYGIGFFTPIRHSLGRRRDDIRFDVKFILPPSNGESLLHIKGFETNLPYFTQEVADLVDLVHFEKIMLTSSGMPIKIKSITATRGSFVTANAPVEGTFRVDGRLELVTSNAPVQSSVTLLNVDDDMPTILNISTSNGAIETDIALYTPSGFDGMFDVNAQTSNAPAAMTYTSSPVESVLRSTIRTLNAPARMSLHPAFEGEFEVESRHALPSVEQQSTEDPAGRDRFRYVSKSRRADRLVGFARWTDASAREQIEEGKVTVTTSNAPAQLIV